MPASRNKNKGSKKSKAIQRQRAGVRSATTQVEPATAVMPAAGATTAPAAPAGKTVKPLEYPYLGSELRTIGILAVVLIIILIILSVVL